MIVRSTAVPKGVFPVRSVRRSVPAIPSIPAIGRSALVLASDRGHFNSPRDVTTAELGDELGITQQAVASRLRRGPDQILETALSE
ncbi:bacterio-opsin activator HTH domain-containing protein [Haloterrigena salina JCM 13891]|uniref:Bacterio-opsin activator HTH domain-containing protein n=1 Tax=Haloterrigena salina JCM 13891 TaxID=1227488 RepID=M0C977_9EURY|nr:bacterio-opsin activator HTH domain-containing protein [Haloterrigena salina JCM 13891]